MILPQYNGGPFGKPWRNANAGVSILTMNNDDALFDSQIPALELLGRGKVRDIYAVDDDHLLIVRSRCSGFV
jgi:hypothetical protein